MIAKLNKDAQGILRDILGIDSSQVLDGTFRPFDRDIEIGDKQVFDLGDGSTVEILASPGHTRITIVAIYLIKILIAGDSAVHRQSGSMVASFSMIMMPTYPPLRSCPLFLLRFLPGAPARLCRTG